MNENNCFCIVKDWISHKRDLNVVRLSIDKYLLGNINPLDHRELNLGGQVQLKHDIPTQHVWEDQILDEWKDLLSCAQRL